MSEYEPTPQPDRPVRGLRCPRCGRRRFNVVYTRPGDAMVMRRRECQHCGTRVTTYERVVGA